MVSFVKGFQLNLSLIKKLNEKKNWKYNEQFLKIVF